MLRKAVYLSCALVLAYFSMALLWWGVVTSVRGLFWHSCINFFFGVWIALLSLLSYDKSNIVT